MEKEIAKMRVEATSRNGNTIEFKFVEKEYKPNKTYGVYECPNCGAVIGLEGDPALNYCYECGSKIEWTEEELECEDDDITEYENVALADVLADYLKSIGRI